MTSEDYPLEDYFNTLDEDGINIDPQCNIYEDQNECDKDSNCIYNISIDPPVCENNTVMDNLELSEMTTDELKDILLTRNRMLEVNLHKNDN